MTETLTAKELTDKMADNKLATVERTPARMGLAPTSIEEGWRLAQMFAKSELVPKNFRNKPEDVMVAIQMGIEIGFAPMQALQSIAVINGRPGVWGDGFLALLMASPLYQDHDEYYEVAGERRDGLTAEDLKVDTTTAVCTFVRRGKAIPVTRRFSVAQAKKAGLLGKEGPWQQYPDRMLAMRARSFAGRDTFPDVLRGIKTAEEMYDTPDTIDVPAPRVVQRLSETRLAGGSLSPAGSSASVEAHPSADVVIVGQVAEVTKVLTDHFLTLMTGECVAVSDDDAIELAKYPLHTTLRLTCAPSADGLRLTSFAIAD